MNMNQLLELILKGNCAYGVRNNNEFIDNCFYINKNNFNIFYFLLLII